MVAHDVRRERDAVTRPDRKHGKEVLVDVQAGLDEPHKRHPCPSCFFPIGRRRCRQHRGHRSRNRRRDEEKSNVCPQKPKGSFNHVSRRRILQRAGSRSAAKVLQGRGGR